MEKQTEGRREVQKKIYSHQCEYHTKKIRLLFLQKVNLLEHLTGTFKF